MALPDPLPSIRLSPSNRDVYHFLCKGDEELFDLHAPYQRGSVWTDERRRNLIKSLLMGLPVGATIVSRLPFDPERPSMSYRVVDGKQRIEAIRAFSRGQLVVPGWWFKTDQVKNPSDRAGGVTVENLSVYGRRSFETCQLPCIEFDGEHEWHENPDFDPDVAAAARRASGVRDPRAHRWNPVPRTAEQLVQAEAELYLLVNFGGVAQTDEDLARAEAVAGR